MSQRIPKPEFVIADFEYSHSTALNLSHDSYLINATNKGQICFRSMSSFRCIFQTNIKDVVPSFSEDILRINAISYCSQYLFVQLKSNNIYVFKCDLNEDLNRISYVTMWSSLEMSFGKCYCLANRYLIFFSFSDPKALIIADTKQMLRTLELKLVTIKNGDDSVITSYYLFLLQLSKFFIKQALFILVSYEDGQLILFGSTSGVSSDSLSIDSNLKAFEVSKIQSHKQLITCFDFNYSNLRGICCSTNNEIAIFDLKIPEIMSTNNTESNKLVNLNDLLQKGRLRLEEDQAKRITIVNHGIMCCAIRPDGRIFATGGRDGRIRLFALRSGKPLAVLSYHTNAIEVIQFTPNIALQSYTSEQSTTTYYKKYLLFACSRDRSITMWSLYNDNSSA